MNRRKSIGLDVRLRAVLKYGERDFLEKGTIVASWKVHLLIKFIQMHCFLEVLGVHEIQDLLNETWVIKYGDIVRCHLASQLGFKSMSVGD